MKVAAPAGPLGRYDELAALVASVAGRPAADPPSSLRAALFLARETRLLDGGELEAWLDLMADDAVVWVPLATAGDLHPATDQSLFLDDRRRLGERVSWRRDPTAWGQQPPSECVRVVGSIEAWAEGDTIVAHSALTLTEHRHGRTQVLAGHQIHELCCVENGLRCRSKILLVPALATSVHNPSFLL